MARTIIYVSKLTGSSTPTDPTLESDAFDNHVNALAYVSANTSGTGSDYEINTLGGTYDDEIVLVATTAAVLCTAIAFSVFSNPTANRLIYVNGVASTAEFVGYSFLSTNDYYFQAGVNTNQRTKFTRCDFFYGKMYAGRSSSTENQRYEKCKFIGTEFEYNNSAFAPLSLNCTYINCINLRLYGTVSDILDNILVNSECYLLGSYDYKFQGAINTKFAFSISTAMSLVTAQESASELITQRDSDLSTTTPSNYFETFVFYPNATDLTTIFCNPDKNNYAPIYDITNNFAFGSFTGAALGSSKSALTYTMKDVANGGDVELYDIATDYYGLGLFAGITNVGVIDNTNEKLNRSATGATNWGVFLVKAKSFGKAVLMKRIGGFGTLVDNSTGQLSINPSDYPNENNTDILTAFSATQDAATLEDDASADFLRFDISRENNYYKDDSGTKKGDKAVGYDAIVADEVIPITQSLMHILIIQDN